MATIIISLGGSIIVPKEINTEFLKDFGRLIINHIKKGNKVAIYCGGGSIARNYQKALKKVIGKDNEALDWMGIATTYLNAFLMKAAFYKYAENKIVENPNKKINFKKSVLICSGWKPGWSTDYDAVLLAKNLGIKELINVTNVDYVYDKNPKQYKNAKPLTKLSWADFRKLAGNKWKPGLNMPFDPIAAKEASKLGLKVFIVGDNPKNLEALLNSKEFKGTVIG